MHGTILENKVSIGLRLTLLNLPEVVDDELRYSYPMLKIFNCAETHTGCKDSRIGFETEGGGAWKVWNRYLTLDGKRAYYLGNICQTCSYMFKRLDGANSAVQIDSAVGALAAGVSGISDPIVTEIGMGLPEDDYIVSFSEFQPQLVLPGQPHDYFVREQIALYGMDGFWGVPHHSQVPYYRAGEVKIGNSRELFHFVIPMFPENWLSEKTIAGYVRHFEDGKLPTAVSLSLLDVKGPADWADEIDITEHWNFAHYLLDGHHKVAAARRLGLPVRLLSFTSTKQGISNREQIEEALNISTYRV